MWLRVLPRRRLRDQLKRMSRRYQSHLDQLVPATAAVADGTRLFAYRALRSQPELPQN
mgnify:CR=1 FL=1